MSQDRTVLVPASTVSVPRVRASRTALRPAVKITRAHVALRERAGVSQSGTEVVSAVAAQLTALLHSPVSLAARLSDATLHPLSHLARQGAFVLYHLSAVDTLAVLEVDSLALGAVLERCAGATEPAAGPFRLTRIEEAALGWVLLNTLSTVRENSEFETRFAPRLVGVFADRAALLSQIDCRERYLGVDVAISVGEVRGKARVLVPSLAVQSALAAVAPSSPTEIHPAVLPACVPVRARVGKAPLTASDVKSLSVGDVILFGPTSFRDGQIHGAASLHGPHFSLHGDLGPEGFTISRSTPPHTQESAMSETAISVDVEVELTRLRLTIAELARVIPGGVFPLHINGAQLVTLRIGDKAIARAELVDIEGELGARIVSIEEAP